MRVYIAGPMTGFPKHNFPAFDAAKLKLEYLGWPCISPADIDRSFGITEESSPEETKRLMAKMVDADYEALKTCSAIYMLTGWEKSVGSRAEHAWAVQHDMTIFYESTIWRAE